MNDTQHPLVVKINSIPSATEDERKIKEHHLRTLGLSLIDIKKYDENIYNYYIKKIVNNKDISIHGHIFEINQCAHFIRTSKKGNLMFQFGDPNLNQPDFLVENFGFEITSSRFTTFNTESNPGIKLLRKFREKNKKNYANTDCVLLIDINQMSYHTIKNGQPVTPTLENIRETICKESKFGLVLYFVEFIQIDNGNLRFKGTVFRDYNKDCNPALKKMMNKNFTHGNQKLGGNLLITPN